MRTTLRRIAHARSGDKGDTSTLSVIAYAPEFYPLLVDQVTIARIAERMGGAVTGPITRYTVEAIEALNFRLDGALGGGVSRNIGIDVYGKALCAAVLDLAVDVPAHLAPLLVGPSDARALLAGSWQLVEYRRVRGDMIVHPFGRDALGWIQYGADGRISATLCRRDRRHFITSVDAHWQGDPAEWAAAGASYLAYTGTYRVHDDRVEHLVEACSYPNWTGTTLTRWFDWSEGGLLALTTAPPGPRDRDLLVSELTWRRPTGAS